MKNESYNIFSRSLFPIEKRLLLAGESLQVEGHHRTIKFFLRHCSLKNYLKSCPENSGCLLIYLDAGINEKSLIFLWIEIWCNQPCQNAKLLRSNRFIASFFLNAPPNFSSVLNFSRKQLDRTSWNSSLPKLQFYTSNYATRQLLYFDT